MQEALKLIKIGENKRIQSNVKLWTVVVPYFCETLSKIKSAFTFVALSIIMCVPISATKISHLKKKKKKFKQFFAHLKCDQN